MVVTCGLSLQQADRACNGQYTLVILHYAEADLYLFQQSWGQLRTCSSCAFHLLFVTQEFSEYEQCKNVSYHSTATHADTGSSRV